MSRIATCLCFAALLASPLTAAGSAEVLIDLTFSTIEPFVDIEASFARDSRFSYLGTPGGLYRLPRAVPAGAQPERIAFPGRAITNLYVQEDVLYVLKKGEERQGASAEDPSLLRTTDGGITFERLDHGLESCFGGWCAFMTASEAAFHDGVMYLNAGGNLLAAPLSAPQPWNWTPLLGGLEPRSCYDPTFALIGRRVLVGGECPLDVAYVRAGTLKEGELAWESEPVDVITPPLGNRNVQFIRPLGDGATVFAGIEGALLRSRDFGATFEFALFYELDAPVYPYITEFLERPDGVLVIAGFDKAIPAPWLALSRDGGRSWLDVSHLVRFADLAFEVVAFLDQDEEGRLLAGLLHSGERTVRIVALELPRGRVRGARRP